MTKQRQAIWHALQTLPGHPTAEEIFLLVREVLPQIAMGTVYRNLGLMVQDGQVVRLAMTDQPDRYDANTMPHEHLCCTACGQLKDLQLPGLAEYLQSQSDEVILSHHLIVRYLCPTCRRDRTEG